MCGTSTLGLDKSQYIDIFIFSVENTERNKAHRKFAVEVGWFFPWLKFPILTTEFLLCSASAHGGADVPNPPNPNTLTVN